MAKWPVPVEVWVGVASSAALPLVLWYWLWQLTADVVAVAPDGTDIPPPGGDPMSAVLPVVVLLAWYACLVGVVRGSALARRLSLVVLVFLLPAGALSLVSLLALCTQEAVRHTMPRGRRAGQRAVSFG